MIRWLFLDVGNVILDEDRLTYHVFRRHWEAVRRACPGLSFPDFLADREQRAARGSRWPLFDAVSAILDEREVAEVWRATEGEVRARYPELSPPISGVVDLIPLLARHYRLGLIANQGAECRQWLARLGLLDVFEVVALSEERRAFKPDLALFQGAIEEAGAPPCECLMVGDRLDNDVAPASTLGMKTAWIRRSRHAAIGRGSEAPEFLAYQESLGRITDLEADRYDGVPPSLILNEVGELIALPPRMPVADGRDSRGPESGGEASRGGRM